MPSFLGIGVSIVGNFIVSKAIEAFTAPDRPDGPALAAYEARGEVSSEVRPKQWIVGRVRTAASLVRHVDVIVPDLADEFFTSRGSGDFYENNPNDLHTDASTYMELYGYFGYAISAGETAGLKGVWVDGVRMELSEPPERNIMEDGEFAPASPPSDADKKEPFFGRFFEELGRPTIAGVLGNFEIGYSGTEVSPAIAIWTHNGGPSGENSYPIRKLREVYDAGDASEDEKSDVANLRAEDVSVMVVRLRQGRVLNKEAPWQRRPEIEVLWEGKGPAAPADVGGYLLDGNPAKAAYWVLRERMGVDDVLIDDVWKQSVKICDEEFTVGAVRNPPSVTDQDIRAAASRPHLQAELRRIAEELGLPATAASIRPAYVEWYRRRLERVVERFTGRNYAQVDAGIVQSIVDKWNERFTGSKNQRDGTRPRYRANGIIASTNDPKKVLDDLAQSMAGSIEEWGGRWYIRAGSLSVRPGNVITDSDIVDGLISQQLEPSLDDQPFELRAGLLQNQRLEYERYVMEPVDRIEANIGEVDATNRPASVRLQEQATAGVRPKRVREMGEYAFVTDPLQADELMRIALYQTRWNTRTISLVVSPGANFKFYGLSRGEPVLLNIKGEGVEGERVGERTDSMRCIVAAPPVYHANGNIELTLRQQDEETFGEKFGLVFDYNDAGDTVLVPPPPPPTEPPTCSATDRQVAPGTTITREDGWQVLGTGGTGRLTYGLTWTNGNPGVSIDSTTGHLIGTVPTAQANTSYPGLVSVTDTKGKTGSCAVELRLSVRPPPPTGRHPWLEVSGLQSAEPQEITAFRAVMRFPQVLSRPFRGAESASWRFSLLPYIGGGSVPAGARITADGVGTWAPPRGATPGSAVARLRASASGFPSVDLPITLVVDEARTKCAVTLRSVQVKRNEALTPTSIFSATNNVTGDLAVDVVLAGVGQPSPLPNGLDLSSGGEVSGTTSVPVGSYRVPVTVRDQNTDTTKRECEQSGVFWVEVQEPETPPTCTLYLGNPTIRRSQRGQIGLRLRGFDGTPPVPTVTGPDWLTVAPGITFDYVLRIGANKTPGRYQYAVRSGRATCGGLITVVEDPPPPLRMANVSLEAVEGAAWGGGMNAVGGAGALSYAWEDAVPTEEVGLVLDTRTGDFSGTAPSDENAPGTYGPWTVVATKGNDTVEAEVTAVVLADTTPPPDPINCVAASLVGRPGDTVSTDGLSDNSCTGPGNLTPDHTSTLAIDSSGNTVAGWTGTWTFSNTVGDPAQPGSSGVIARFSTPIPAGQALGEYTFVNTVRSDEDVRPATMTVKVTVAAQPLSIPAAQLMVRRAASSAFSRTLSPSGGPSTGDYDFARASGQEGWISISPAGVVSWPAQNRAVSGVFRFTLTKGSQTKTFDLAYQLTTGGGTGPVDPESDEELV